MTNLPGCIRKTYLLRIILAITGFFLFGDSYGQESRQSRPYGIVIHGGGGVRPREKMTPELEKAYRSKLSEALTAGYRHLADGGSGVDAVEAALRVLEDSPLFNAGKGASFTNAGTTELDAAIMDGNTLRAGAVGAVKHIKNPISLARMVMEKTPHVLIVGEGALAFAQEQGVKWVPQDYFYTERKWKSLLRRQKLKAPYGTKIKGAWNNISPKNNEPIPDSEYYGTVGAVALDKMGNLAAGTSTGGRITKRPGRVGDSPIIGAGTYANNSTCAVSTTGLGEKHMVLLTAKEISALMAYKGMSVEEAANNALKEQLAKIGGQGGAIVIDKDGHVAMTFTGDGMYRGYAGGDGTFFVKIYKD